jgi:hypothetical protein
VPCRHNNNNKITFLYSPSEPRFSIRLTYQRIDIIKSIYYRHIHSQASEPSNRTIHNQPDIKEPRGRPRKITAIEINIIERIVEEADV